MKSGKVVILSGPSGVGKNTVLDLLLKQVPHSTKINTATTRAPREGEVDGVDHYFISESEFKKRIKDGSITEYNIYNNNYYGTLKEPLIDAVSKGKIGVMEIDVNGAMAIKKQMPEVVTIFLNAESMEVIEQRIRERGTETEASIQRRLQTAADEIAVSKQYDHIVINPEGHPEKAVAQIEEILAS